MPLLVNHLFYPKLNPVKFYKPSPDTSYNSRHIDDFEFFDSIEDWQEQADYWQPWQQSDHIFLQLMSDFGPHNIKVLNDAGDVIRTVAFQEIIHSADDPTMKIYQLDFDLSLLPEGVYRLQMESGIDDKLILVSNKIDVCAVHKKSILLDYGHYKYHEGVMFETGIRLRLRVEGSNKFKSPASKDEDFEDQSLDESLLSSVPYNLFELIIGDERGVPPFMIDMVNRVFTCSDVLIDGRKFVKPAGNKWEGNEVEGWPAKGWKAEVREGVNRGSMVYENNLSLTSRIAIVINSDSKGFGTDTGGTVNQVIDVQ